MFEKSFIKACLSGDALLGDIDAYIEHWHTHETGNTLSEFLGMSNGEYEAWLKSGEDIVLRNILAARDNGIPYEEYVQSLGHEAVKVSVETRPIENEDFVDTSTIQYRVEEIRSYDDLDNENGCEYIVERMVYKEYQLDNEVYRDWDGEKVVFRSDDHVITVKIADLLNSGELNEKDIDNYVNAYKELDNHQDRQRLFVDMDGTIAVFTPVDQLEKLYEPGWFENAAPMENVLLAVKHIIRENPDIEVNILSAYLSDSKYALEEKIRWLDKNLPEINEGHRIFVSCGEDKKAHIPGGIRSNDFLLDDYTHNLTLWEPPARGIKLLNGINHTKGTWGADKLRYDKSPDELANNIVSIMNGAEHVYDANRRDAGETGIIGVASWTRGRDCAYTDANEYIAVIKEEIEFRASSGFQFITVTNDPDIRKAVDDIVYGVYGEKNPHDVGYYSRIPATDPERTRLQNFFSGLCLEHGLDKEVVRDAYNRQMFSDHYVEEEKSFCFYGYKDVERVAIFSDRINALSHASLDMMHTGDYTAIDRIMLGKEPFPALVDYLEGNPGVKNIVICTSICPADSKIAEQLKDELLKAGYTPEKGYHCERQVPPSHKNYNEYLLAYKAAQEEDGFFPEAEPEGEYEP